MTLRLEVFLLVAVEMPLRPDQTLPGEELSRSFQTWFGGLRPAGSGLSPVGKQGDRVVGGGGRS